MVILESGIVTAPSKILSQPAQLILPQEIKSTKIQRLISDMKRILSREPDGVGLAAPQLGVSLRIFIVSEEAKVIDPKNGRIHKRDTNIRMKASDTDTKKQLEYHVFISPVLKKQSRRKIEMTEGCLSLPGKYGLVSRSEKVVLEWYDQAGKKHSRGFAKFFARVIQHEMDHLYGTLIADRAKRLLTVSSGPQGYER